MGEWHRDNPELAGTDADPWMQHENHRRAVRDVAMATWRSRDGKTLDQLIAEAEAEQDIQPEEQ